MGNWNALDDAMLSLMTAKEHMLEDESGDVNVISIVLLIAVAVVLIIAFKTFAGDLLDSMFEQVGNKANSIFE